MHIKKFTQFIVENEHYSSINEADIVPGVTFNSGLDKTGKETNMMYVHARGKDKQTVISFKRNYDESTSDIHLNFNHSSDPEGLPMGKGYAFVSENKPGENDLFYHAAVTKMEDFDADKSGVSLNNSSNSIDLLADFMQRSGIGVSSTAGANLAKVITTLLLSPNYNTLVTDTFKKFATKIGGQISRKAFLPRMAAQFGNSGTKQSAGMQSFIEEWPKSYAALKPPKKA